MPSWSGSWKGLIRPQGQTLEPQTFEPFHLHEGGMAPERFPGPEGRGDQQRYLYYLLKPMKRIRGRSSRSGDFANTWTSTEGNDTAGGP
jgi:hypothetical protein